MNVYKEVILVKYYKLLNGNEFVGVGTSNDLRRFQTKHRILLACDESQAQYLQCGDELYRASWMIAETTNSLHSTNSQIIEIDAEEYQILSEALNNGEDVVITPEETYEDIDEPVIDVTDEITLEFVKDAKIREMNKMCNNVITNGFDATLSDNQTYHFSLTTQDQLNLITLSSMVANGEQSIPYHADGELCKFYSAEDINIIVTTATSHKTYHISYFNALREYIESLDSIDVISSITYGITIPDAYQSDVLKVLLAQQN